MGETESCIEEGKEWKEKTIEGKKEELPAT
jgi:hypothetical protein